MKKFAFALVCFTAAWQSFAQPQPGTVLWTYDAGVSIQTSPVLALDGTTYIVTTGLLAITNNGSIASNKWSFPAGGSLPYVGAPAVGSDGTIYAVSGSLFALNPDGTQKWSYPAIGGQGSPAIGLDNTIYFAAGGFLQAVSATGTKKWDYDIGGPSSGGLHPPVIGSDGTIYVGLERNLFALSPYGTNKWSVRRVSTGDSASPTIGSDGTVYIAAGSLDAYSSAGTNLWSSGGSGPVVIGRDGSLYVPGPVNNTLFAISQEGQPLWQTNLHALPFGYPTAPAIDAGGRIYYCVSNSVWALNPEGQAVWKVTTYETAPLNAELANTSPTIGPDGTLYTAIGRTLYAIATGTNGPAISPWPMDRQNARHTGKIEKPALRQPQKRSDANFQFQLYGQLGVTFTVEATTNFNTWTSVTSFVANTLPMDVVDLTASNHPSRFYRASSPP